MARITLSVKGHNTGLEEAIDHKDLPVQAEFAINLGPYPGRSRESGEYFLLIELVDSEDNRARVDRAGGESFEGASTPDDAQFTVH